MSSFDGEGRPEDPDAGQAHAGPDGDKTAYIRTSDRRSPTSRCRRQGRTTTRDPRTASSLTGRDSPTALRPAARAPATATALRFSRRLPSWSSRGWWCSSSRSPGPSAATAGEAAMPLPPGSGAGLFRRREEQRPAGCGEVRVRGRPAGAEIGRGHPLGGIGRGREVEQLHDHQHLAERKRAQERYEGHRQDRDQDHRRRYGEVVGTGHQGERCLEGVSERRRSIPSPVGARGPVNR